MDYRDWTGLVGVRRKVLGVLERLLSHQLRKTRRGPPHRLAPRRMLLLALMRLRLALPLRLMARLFAVPHVTLWRCCRLVTDFLAGCFAPPGRSESLIVDTTSTRVHTTAPEWYSAHRKARVAKVQVLCDERGVVHHVSRTYPGGVHDKTIWNESIASLPEGATVLADKAYAGASGEGTVLFRPVRRNERAWRDDPAAARATNAHLSTRRVRIEHLFARLKTWRIIHYCYPVDPSSYDTTFRAIAFIHNLNLEHGRTAS